MNNRFAGEALKKADRLYHTDNGYENNVDWMEKSVKKLKELQPGKDSEELQEIIGNILINLSDIASRCGISQEQILTDRIEDFFGGVFGCRRNFYFKKIKNALSF